MMNNADDVARLEMEIGLRDADRGLAVIRAQIVEMDAAIHKAWELVRAGRLEADVLEAGQEMRAELARLLVTAEEAAAELRSMYADLIAEGS